MLELIAFTYGFWLLFLAVMSLYRAYKLKTIGKLAFYLGYPAVIVGALIDVIFNVLIGTVLFLDWPREWLFTQRLIRYKIAYFDWRNRIAVYICEELLDPFDIGQGHCQ